jgi:L-alanine-DL-glutamate epimerase-like enolase superfamily enzyme
MKITDIRCHVLVDPDYDITSTSSSQDDIVVEIETDEGLIGIGEADVNPWIAKACIEAPGTHTMGLGIRDTLIGADPLQVEALWDRLYVGTAMNGRRGAVVHAYGAVDMALHDLRGKILGKPVWQLFKDVDAAPTPRQTVPYASLQPEPGGFEQYTDSMVNWALVAKKFGFTALKAEVTVNGPYAHQGMQEPYRRAGEVLAAVREAVGDDFTLMCDVQYMFPDARTCLDVVEDWADLNLRFLETPLSFDDLDGYAEVAAHAPMPIAAGEFLATRFEFLDLMDRGRVSVVQPDMGRVGGLTEAMRVGRLAQERGLTVVPHVWKTGLSIAAAVNFAAATPGCEFVEYLPAELSESPLRQQLIRNVPELIDGRLSPSTAPGLGVELDRDALEHFASAAAALDRGTGA